MITQTKQAGERTQLGDLELMRRTQSVGDAISEVQRLINWLEYVRENEFTDAECERLKSASRRFIKTAQPIASKYLD